MRKYAEPLENFTIKLTAREYARLSIAAELRHISMGQLIRDFANTLPEMPLDLVNTRRKFKGSIESTQTLEEAELRHAVVSAFVEKNKGKSSYGHAEWEKDRLQDQINDLKGIVSPANAQAAAAEAERMDKLQREHDKEQEQKRLAGDTTTPEPTSELTSYMSAGELAELEDRAENGDAEAAKQLGVEKARRAEATGRKFAPNKPTEL